MTKQSEAIVLRTYPLREADLLVTLFTRAEGKVKGVAKAAKKSKRRFGGALEPLTLVRAYWEDREKQELARLDACELLESPLADAVDYPRAVALAHVGEVLDELLPEREPNDAVFRLALGVLRGLRHTAALADSPRMHADERGRGKPQIFTDEHGSESNVSASIREDSLKSVAEITGTSIWLPLTYFDLWMLRLVGFLADLSDCIVCGAALNGGRAYYHALADGLMCPAHKRLASRELSKESRELALEMFRSPLESFAVEPWTKERAADLRRFLWQTMERHLERKLATAGMLEKL